jgi:hypothetical protein
MPGTQSIGLRGKQPRLMVKNENPSWCVFVFQRYGFQSGDIIRDPEVRGYYRGAAFHRDDILIIE